MAAIHIGPYSRVTKDEGSGALRSWYDITSTPQTAKAFKPRAVARSVLEQSAVLFSWKPALADLRDGNVTEGQGSFSVRFTQDFKGVPVDASEVVVNMHADSRVHTVYNNYHYDIPHELDPKTVKFDSKYAVQVAERLVARSERREITEPVLIVYQHRFSGNHPPKGEGSTPGRTFVQAMVASIQSGSDASNLQPREGQYFLAWDIRVLTRDPAGRWRILVDAATGRLIAVIDLVQYAAGNAEVFDPNPIVTGGDTTLRHTSTAATINAQRAAVSVDRLDPPSGGQLRLHGTYVHMAEVENPAIAEPQDPAGNFSYSFDDNNFLDAMTYFHVDRFQDYIQSTLGITNAANYSIPVDPQGFDAIDNSHYVTDTSPSTGKGHLAFGGGTVPVPSDNPVPDAADAMVVLHEYGHAIQDNSNPDFDNPPDGTGEGFGDFLAAVYFDDKHANPAATRGFMMSWDSEMGTGSWPGRRYDVSWLYGDANYNLSGDNHYHGQFWCATMFELYRKLGGDSQYPWVKSAGRDLTIRLHLMANFNVPAHASTAAQMAQQVEVADSHLGGWRYADGLHRKVIYDTFRRRGIPGYSPLPVDVYINDGRHGGYGSLTGNDLFTEKQFLDNYWSTQDLWVTVVQYANDADQQAGDPGDHVEPPVGTPAYLYVRVKNKGASGSGPVTVRAFHSDPTIGLVWPTDWTANDTPSIGVPNIPAGGKVVVGPFTWTPSHVGHECVFAIAECANDHAVTQDLPAMTAVAHADLVPFDNNIAQRNLYPTASKGKMLRGFWVSNPGFERAVVQLHFESTLPRGWTFHTSLARDAIELAPRERRWVEVTIDQHAGEEITRFDNPPALTISGTIGGKLIGGVGFYAAPPSAFPKPPHEGVPCAIARPGDVLSLPIPWGECEMEGEIDIKLRFRRCLPKSGA